MVCMSSHFWSTTALLVGLTFCELFFFAGTFDRGRLPLLWDLTLRGGLVLFGFCCWFLLLEDVEFSLLVPWFATEFVSLELWPEIVSSLVLAVSALVTDVVKDRKCLNNKTIQLRYVSGPQLISNMVLPYDRKPYVPTPQKAQWVLPNPRHWHLESYFSAPI